MDNWITAVFDNFIRRDVFAKIGPGFVLLFALLVFVAGWVEANGLVLNLSSGGWFAAMIIAWITGLAVQSVGERFRLIRYYPHEVCERDFRELTERFRSRLDYERRRPEHERLIVIKEACGIGCASLFLSTVLFGARYVVADLQTGSCPDWRTWVQIIVIVGLDVLVISSLYRMHRQHAERQWHYMRWAVDQPDD